MLIMNEELKKYIQEECPDFKPNNQYFFDEKSFDDFSMDTIINKLSQLSRDNAFHLYMNLYQYGNFESTRDMIKHIIEENIGYFISGDKKMYSTESIIREYTRLYKLREYSMEDLKKVEKANLEHNKCCDNNFARFDINYYNELIIIQKLYKEGKIKYSDVLPFIELTFELLKYNLIKVEGNYESKYDTYINEIISHLLIGNISPDLFYSCMIDYQKVKNLLVVSKLGNIILRFNSVPLDVIYTIKGKQIKNIYHDFLKINGLDKVKNNYTESDIIAIITNMSFLLGTDNVNNIIRHLPQDYIKVDRLFRAFLNIDFSNIQIKDGQVMFNNDFIKFFMGNNLEEPNSLLNLIYEGKTKLADKLETLYAYWDLLEMRYKLQPLKTRLAFLEESLNTNMVILNPDEYRLEGNIINSYYDNKQFQNLNNIKLVEQIREEYKKIRHNYQKTIPYISGEYDGYYYETIKANDPNLFVMGSISNCCFKIGGDADSFVRYCAEDLNGRVLAVKNKNGNIVAMAPMVRNGNLILCNSIEGSNVNNKYFMTKMFEILEIVGNNMIEISNNTESVEDSIHALLIGSYKNEISNIGKYKRVVYGEIADKCINPLDSTIYVNMGGFDWDNYIISSIPNLNYNKLRSFNPSTIYDDPREEVVELEREYINENVKKIVTSIYFEKYGKVPNFDNIGKVIFNEDWLIVIDKKYKITSCIVSLDPRAHEEYQDYLNIAREHCSYYDDNGNFIETKKYNYK